MTSHERPGQPMELRITSGTGGPGHQPLDEDRLNHEVHERLEMAEHALRSIRSYLEGERRERGVTENIRTTLNTMLAAHVSASNCW